MHLSSLAVRSHRTVLRQHRGEITTVKVRPECDFPPEQNSILTLRPI